MCILTVLSFTSKYIGKCGERRIATAKIVKETIHAKGIDIGIYTTNFENEFISLTDIAKYRNEDDPRFVIQNWMRNRNTIEFLGVWEELHNPDFNRVQFEAVKNEAGLNRFVMTPTKWITQMNAIGIVSKAGRYGGTYAHSDIAMSFATWISPEFQLYIMKDYRRLKTDENSRLSLNWNLNREISKLNYRIHTDAIKEKLELLIATDKDKDPLFNFKVMYEDVLQFEEELKKQGFYYRPKVDLGEQLLFASGSYYDGTGDLQTHFIHIVKAGSRDWKNYINFRDYLNSTPSAAKAYEDLKVSLAEQAPTDNGRENYLKGKHDFIAGVLRKTQMIAAVHQQND